MPEQDPEDWRELDTVLRRELEIQKVRTQAIEEMIESLHSLHGQEEGASSQAAHTPHSAAELPTASAAPAAAATDAPAPPARPADRPPIKLPMGGPDVRPIAGAILASGAGRLTSSGDDPQPDGPREITARMDRRALRAGHMRERAERARDSARRAVGSSGFGVVTAGAAVALGAAAMMLALPHATHTPRGAHPAPTGPEITQAAPALPTTPTGPSAAVAAQPRPALAALPPDLANKPLRVRPPDRWVPRDEPQIEIVPAPRQPVRSSAQPAPRAERDSAQVLASASRAPLATHRRTAPRSAERRHKPVLLASRPTLLSPVSVTGPGPAHDVDRAAPMPAPVQTADVTPTARGGDGSDEEGARFGTGGARGPEKATTHRTPDRDRAQTAHVHRTAPDRRERVSAPLSYGNFGDDMPGERLGREISGPHVADDEDARYDSSRRADRATVRICVESGMLATRWCPHTALLNTRRDRLPTRTCRLHHGP